MPNAVIDLPSGTDSEHITALYSIAINTLLVVLESRGDPIEALEWVSKRTIETLRNKEYGTPTNPEFLTMLENIFNSIKSDPGMQR